MFWPRCAVVMNARLRPGPANTMSRGSSPTSSVRDRRCGLARSGHVDDADAVGEVVDDPDLVVAPRRDGDRLEADRDRGERATSRSAVDAEDLEAVVRRVDREQAFAVGDSASGRTCPLSKSQ